MLHFYIVKTALSGKLPEGTLHIEIPERETFKMWGEDVVIPWEDFDEAGWKAAVTKHHRIISDGSGDIDGCHKKIDRCCGEGKPIGTREILDNLTRTFRSYILSEIKKKGIKEQKIGKMGNTVDLVTACAKKHGVSDTKIKKCLAQSKKIAALLDEEIE